jgi:hypothetical protein
MVPGGGIGFFTDARFCQRRGAEPGATFLTRRPAGPGVLAALLVSYHRPSSGPRRDREAQVYDTAMIGLAPCARARRPVCRYSGCHVTAVCHPD